MFNIQEWIVPTVLIICLCVGYAIKHVKAIDIKFNDYIPLALLILGALLSCLMVGSCSIEAVAQGMLTGLASVGLHQAFTRTIEGLSSNND